MCVYHQTVAWPHLHGERGVDAVVEVQVGGAVVGPVSDPQVAVADSSVQLLLYGELLQHQGGQQAKLRPSSSHSQETALANG